jgi:hypothetical protein
LVIMQFILKKEVGIHKINKIGMQNLHRNPSLS